MQNQIRGWLRRIKWGHTTKIAWNYTNLHVLAGACGCHLIESVCGQELPQIMVHDKLPCVFY